MDAGYFCYLERGRRVPSVIVAEVLIDSFVQAARQGDALADEDLAWLDSIEDHVKGTDPLLQPLAPSEPPEATPQNLTPLPRRRQSARRSSPSSPHVDARTVRSAAPAYVAALTGTGP